MKVSTALLLEDHPLSRPDCEIEKYLTALKSRENQLKELCKCRDDPWYFITGWVFTLDEHDPRNPVKPFPGLPYLRHLVYRFLTEDLLIVFKSRQVMASWLFSALHLWETIFFPGKQMVFQTKKADDADDLVERCWFIWANLPAFIKSFAPVNPKNKGEHLYCKLKIPSRNSRIDALPEGIDQIRRYTASRVWLDEIQEQGDIPGVLGAVKPALMGGGKLLLVGTAKPGYFAELVNGNSPELPEKYRIGISQNQPSPINGISERRNSLGYLICEVSYTAHPDKNPHNEIGKAWLQKAKTGIPWDQWQREMERDCSLSPGKKFFPEFEPDLHIASYQWNPETPLLRGWDFGYHYPALVACQFDNRDRFRILDSFRKEDLVLDDFLSAALNWCAEKFPGACYQDFIDPSGFAQTHHCRDTDALVMRKNGLKPQGKKVKDEDAARMFRLLLSPRKDRLPGLLMAENAGEMIRLFSSGLLFSETENTEVPAEIHPWIDLWDALKYLAAGVMNPLSLKPASPYLEKEKREKWQEQKLVKRFKRALKWQDWGRGRG